MSHQEGHKKGLASNHGDVGHIWDKFGLTMQQFRKDIKAAMEGSPAADSLTAIMGKAQTTERSPVSHSGTVDQSFHLQAYPWKHRL